MSRVWRVMVVALVPLLGSCTAPGSAGTPAAPGRELGLEILGVHLVSGGDLAQLDYRVLDFQKAKAALAGEVRLVPEEGTGRLEVMSLGRLGPMKQRPARSGVRQFMLFTNTGRALKKGGSAAMILTGGRVSGIPVT